MASPPGPHRAGSAPLGGTGLAGPAAAVAPPSPQGHEQQQQQVHHAVPEDLLTCGVCYHRFEPLGRRPIDLGCGHCFCEACLATSPASFARCPECRHASHRRHVSVALLRIINELPPAPPLADGGGLGLGPGGTAAATPASAGAAAGQRVGARVCPLHIVLPRCVRGTTTLGQRLCQHQVLKKEHGVMDVMPVNRRMETSAS